MSLGSIIFTLRTYNSNESINNSSGKGCVSQSSESFWKRHEEAQQEECWDKVIVELLLNNNARWQQGEVVQNTVSELGG
jgi:hypothetical protein